MFGKKVISLSYTRFAFLLLNKVDFLSWHVFKFYRKYIFAFIVCPIVFYVPRFFEIRSYDAVYSYNQTLNCSSMFLPGSGFHFNIINNKSSNYLALSVDGK